MKIYNIKSKLGNHTVCILVKPPFNFYYTNGPAVYKIESLLKIKNFKSESFMAYSFKIRKWYTAFTYRGLSCSKIHNFSTECQGLCNQLSLKSTHRGKRNICIKDLY